MENNALERISVLKTILKYLNLLILGT